MNNKKEIIFFKKFFKKDFSNYDIHTFKFRKLNFNSKFNKVIFNKQNNLTKLIINLFYREFLFNVKNWEIFIKKLHITSFISKSVSDNNNIFIFSALKQTNGRSYCYTRSYFKGDSH